MKSLRISVIFAIAVSLAAGFAIRAAFPEKGPEESIFLSNVAPGILFGPKMGSPPRYESKEGPVAFNSFDVSPGIRGYAGPIKLLLSIDRRGNILGVRILSHGESPNYVRGMEGRGFLGQFVGKNINDPLKIDADLDGVSRATVSVEALAQTVRVSGRTVAQKVMGLEVQEEEGRRRLGYGSIACGALFALTIPAFFLTRRKKGLLRLRDLMLVLGVVFLGLWLSSPFSVLHVFNLLLLRPSTDVLWFVLLSGVFVSLVLAGRLYCGWLCPFGAVSEFLGRLPVRKWRIEKQVDERWRRLKYFLLSAVSALVLLSAKVDYGNFETYVTLFSFSGNFLAWTLVSVCLLATLRVRRFWCRYLCPGGALMGALSREKEGYPSGPDCPMGNWNNPPSSECIGCNRCYGGPQKTE